MAKIWLSLSYSSKVIPARALVVFSQFHVLVKV